jgi:hypothetical protein
MMDTKALKLLAEYNKKTNGEIDRLIERISSAQWDHQF